MMNKLKDFFLSKRRAYQTVLNPKNPQAEMVLADLKKFCRGSGSKFMGDHDRTLVMIGRNEVWERIQSFLNIPDDELAKIVENMND